MADPVTPPHADPVDLICPVCFEHVRSDVIDEHRDKHIHAGELEQQPEAPADPSSLPTAAADISVADFDSGPMPESQESPGS